MLLRLATCARLCGMTLEGACLTNVKRLMPVLLLVACAGLMHASVIQTLTIDLSPLKPGSILSGSVILQNPLMLGDSTQIPLTFSDPADYSPATVMATLSVTNGVPNDQFRFSGVSFIYLANNKTYNLTVVGAATCVVDYPCTATGGYEANSPPAFSGKYTVTSAAAPAVPEPGYGLLESGLLGGLVLARALFRLKPARPGLVRSGSAGVQ